MTEERREYTVSEHVALLSQVDSCCPDCGAYLFARKKGRTYKLYELAHIYPLNPLSTEVAELKNEIKLNADPNNPDNIIVELPGFGGQGTRITLEGNADVLTAIVDRLVATPFWAWAIPPIATSKAASASVAIFI